MNTNTITVKNICPRCGRRGTIKFTPDYVADPAFVECAKGQPWQTLCKPCRDWISISSARMFSISAAGPKAIDAMRGWELPA